MSVSLEIPFRGSVQSAKDNEATFRWLADWPISVGGQFPGLTEFRETEPNVFSWRFQEVGYQAFRLAIALKTRREAAPPKTISAVPLPGPHRLGFQWRLAPAAQGCRADFEAKISLDLPVPSLMKGLVTGFAEIELRSLLEQYLQHVEKALRT